MAESARKLDENEKPNLKIIEGGSVTPERTQLHEAENKGIKFRPSNSLKDIKKQESSGDKENTGWNNNVTGKIPKNNRSRGKSFLKGLKKRGPVVGIIGAVLGGGTILTVLTAPSLLIINLKEVMVDKFNYQLTSMELRTNKILRSKINGTTSGVCSGVISIRCKYSTLSENQIKKLTKAGLEIEADGNTVLNRTKVKNIKFNGETIAPNDFMNKYLSDTNFRTAMKKAYNPKFMGFADAVWDKVASRVKISKKAIKLEGEDDAAKLKNIQDSTKNGIPDKQIIDSEAKKGYKTNGEDITLTEDELSKANTDELLKTSKEVAESGKKTVTGLMKGGAKVVKIAARSIGVAATVQTACEVYSASQAVSNAAKAVRSLQLQRFAMVFLNNADQTKAGTADPDTISYLGKILTTPDPVTKKTATDSGGYKNAAYNETGTLSTSSSQYLAGGGLAGELSGITNEVGSILGSKKNADSTCGVVNSPAFTLGSAVVGVVAIIGTGGGFTAVQVAQMAAGAGFSVALIMLPAMLQDIVAGVLVDEGTIGEGAGDAITSGSGALMSSLAAVGGNAPLTPAQAVAYNELSQDVASQYATEDQLTSSPFDITNSNTFLGKIVYGLTPYLSKMSSLSGTLSSITSLIAKTFSSIFIPNTHATTASDYEICQDYDYRELGLATDMFCNVVYGIPEEDLDIDPITVLDKMKGEINTETGEAISGTAYDNFLNNCVNRSVPLGYAGEDLNGDDGTGCLYSDANKYFYLYTIDKRILDGMEAVETAINKSSSFYGSGKFFHPCPDCTTKTSDYGWRILNGEPVFHKGVDFSGGTDNPIYAAADGVVEWALTEEDGDGSAGNWVVIKHEGDLYTTYMHLRDKPMVSTGQKVTAGQQLGIMGNTGDSYGAHLHFQLSTGDFSSNTVDPLQYLDPDVVGQ